MLFNKSNMQYRRLGHSGLLVSVISFGFWTNACSSYQENKELVIKCLQNGINYFDTAEAYSNGKNEQDLGKIFKQLGQNRSHYVISTKIWKSKDPCINSYENTNKKHIKQGMIQCLKRLQMDYVDAVYAHDFDEESPLEEICRGFHEIIEEGQAFYWATSNWDADRVLQAIKICEKYNLHKPIGAQNQYNMINRSQIQEEYKTLFEVFKYGLVAYSPLLGGYLTGKYLDDKNEEGRFKSEKTSGWSKEVLTDIYYHGLNLERVNESLRKLKDIAEKELDCQLLHLALAWVIKFRHTSSALIGARNVKQLEGTLKALQVTKRFTSQLQGKVNKILQTQPRQRINYKSWIPLPHMRPYSQN